MDQSRTAQLDETNSKDGRDKNSKLRPGKSIKTVAGLLIHTGQRFMHGLKLQKWLQRQSTTDLQSDQTGTNQNHAKFKVYYRVRNSLLVDPWWSHYTPRDTRRRNKSHLQVSDFAKNSNRYVTIDKLSDLHPIKKKTKQTRTQLQHTPLFIHWNTEFFHFRLIISSMARWTLTTSWKMVGSLTLPHPSFFPHRFVVI